jgi:DNA-binding GntR family transcriptional regulator
LARQQQTTHTLADNIRQKLISAIVEGEIPQGSKVSEVELATRYGVSRGPLREAMRDLEGLRLVERKPHAGVRVVALNCAELKEIFTIREALEGMAARLAATEMSDQEISSLRKLLELHESKVRESQGQSYFQQHGDLDFHLRILSGSGNRRLYKLMGDELYQLILMYRRQSSQRPSRPLRALEEHKRICDAIEARDPELAEMLMRRHIQGAKNSLQTCIEETT